MYVWNVETKTCTEIRNKAKSINLSKLTSVGRGVRQIWCINSTSYYVHPDDGQVRSIDSEEIVTVEGTMVKLIILVDRFFAENMI